MGIEDDLRKINRTVQRQYKIEAGVSIFMGLLALLALVIIGVIVAWMWGAMS